jgi:hypothetical protein
MMSKGMIRIAETAFTPTTSLALLLSASASPGGDRPEIVQIAEVEEALVLGADIVKTNWPGDGESFGKLVEAANGIPVVLAGGSRLEDGELLMRMEQAVAAGAIGCSVGRNIFMHRSPEAITRALSRVIRERWSAEKALAALREELGDRGLKERAPNGASVAPEEGLG